MKKFLWQLMMFIRALIKAFFADSCSSRAAAMAFTTLLSLVPLMAVMLGVISYFPQTKVAMNQVQNYIFSHFVALSGRTIKMYLQLFVKQVPNLSVTGLVALVFASWLLMVNLEAHVNRIWHVGRSRRKWLALIQYVFAVMLIPTLMLGSITVSSFLASSQFWPHVVTALNGNRDFYAKLPFVFAFFSFFLVFYVLPNCHVPAKSAAISALVATLLFSATKKVFIIYTKSITTYTLLYGAFSVLPLFLIWLYLVWLIFFIGVELSYMLTLGHDFRSKQRLDGFTHAVSWLRYIGQSPKGLRLDELVNKDKVAYKVKPESMLAALVGAKLIRQTWRRRLVLLVELREFSFYCLWQRLGWRLPEINHTNRDYYTEAQIHAFQLHANQCKEKLSDYTLS